MKNNLIFWCKSSVIDEAVHNRKRQSDEPPYSPELYEEMCKEPIKAPNGDVLGYEHNYPYIAFYEDGTTETIFEREFKKRFKDYKMPEHEMSAEKQKVIESFIKKYHGL